MSKNLLSLYLTHLKGFIGKTIKDSSGMTGVVVGYDNGDRLIVRWKLTKLAKSWGQSKYEVISSNSGNYDLV